MATTSSALLAVLICLVSCPACNAFLAPPSTLLSRPSPHRAAKMKAERLGMTMPQTGLDNTGTTSSHSNILILDHVNINHEKGRHDLLKAFYFDTLGCAVDPRKIENIERQRKTLWANAGINQMHLPEEEAAQVFDGKITLEYSSLSDVKDRLASPPSVLAGSRFSWSAMPDDSLAVTCPWGNSFELRANGVADSRGTQPGDTSEPLGMPEVQVNVPHEGNMAGIARFYRDMVGAEASEEEDGRVVRVRCGPRQQLVFQKCAEGVEVEHSDYHISMYVSDFEAMFQRMEALGLIWVNPRFKRKAHNLEEALQQCMFRVKDVVDPAKPADGPIIVLEHEIRSPTKTDGTPYKSCPFNT